MFSALDLYEEKLKAEAAEKVRRETMDKARRMCVGNMLRGGFDAETAARICEITVDEVESISADLDLTPIPHQDTPA